MLPKVPLSYLDDQRAFLAALREVAADALLHGKSVPDWEIIETRPATGPRGEARFASYVIQSKDYVRQSPGSTPVRILFRGSAIAGPSSVKVDEYQLLPHPYYVAEYNPDRYVPPAIIDQFAE